MALYEGQSLSVYSVECDGETVVVAARDIMEAVKISGFHGQDPKTIEIEWLGGSQESEPGVLCGKAHDEE